MLHIKFGFDWPSGFREEDGLTHVYSPGAGADNPLGPKYFHKNSAEVDIAPASGKITKNVNYRSRAPG